MPNDNSITRCAKAVLLIDTYLRENQKDDRYTIWPKRNDKPPGENEDAFLFGKLVQAIFSGGFKGDTVDKYMPKMKKVFHNWDVEWISRLTKDEVESINELEGVVIRNRRKLNAVVLNAKEGVSLTSQYGSFRRYLNSFADIDSMSVDLVRRFSCIGEVTKDDFLRNVGYIVAKIDLHLTRWLERMRAIDNAASFHTKKTIIDEIVESAKIAFPEFDSVKFDEAIYLFCANRKDVLEAGGICGDVPKCEICPILALCPKREVPPSPPGKAPQSSPKKSDGVSHPKPKPDSETVWDTTYPKMRIEEIKRINPYASKSWLIEPFREETKDRRWGVKRLFAGKTTVEKGRIKKFGGNHGRYVAFRAIVHGYATWKNGVLERSPKVIQ